MNNWLFLECVLWWLQCCRLHCRTAWPSLAPGPRPPAGAGASCPCAGLVQGTSFSGPGPALPSSVPAQAPGGAKLWWKFAGESTVAQWPSAWQASAEKRKQRSIERGPGHWHGAWWREVWWSGLGWRMRVRPGMDAEAAECRHKAFSWDRGWTDDRKEDHLCEDDVSCHFHLPRLESKVNHATFHPL